MGTVREEYRLRFARSPGRGFVDTVQTLYGNRFHSEVGKVWFRHFFTLVIGLEGYGPEWYLYQRRWKTRRRRRSR